MEASGIQKVSARVTHLTPILKRDEIRRKGWGEKGRGRKRKRRRAEVAIIVRCATPLFLWTATTTSSLTKMKHLIKNITAYIIQL